MQANGAKIWKTDQFLILKMKLNKMHVSFYTRQYADEAFYSSEIAGGQ